MLNNMRRLQLASSCNCCCSIFMYFSFRSVPCSLRDAVKIISLVTIAGAWVGAFPIPLDWDRDWQVCNKFYLVLQLQLLLYLFLISRCISTSCFCESCVRPSMLVFAKDVQFYCQKHALLMKCFARASSQSNLSIKFSVAFLNATDAGFRKSD